MPQPTFGDGEAQTPPHIFSVEAHVMGVLEPPPTLTLIPAAPVAPPVPVVPPAPRPGGSPGRPPIPTGDDCAPPVPRRPPVAGGGASGDPPTDGGIQLLG